jgi:hypothetical protein
LLVSLALAVFSSLAGAAVMDDSVWLQLKRKSENAVATAENNGLL